MLRAVHADISSWRVKFYRDKGIVKNNVVGYDGLGFKWREWGRGRGVISGV